MSQNSSIDCLPAIPTGPCLNGTFSKIFTCGQALQCNPKKYQLFDLSGSDIAIAVALDEAAHVEKCLFDWNYKLSMRGVSQPCEYRDHRAKSQPTSTATYTNFDTNTSTSSGKTATKTSTSVHTMTASPSDNSASLSKASFAALLLSLASAVFFYF